MEDMHVLLSESYEHQNKCTAMISQMNKKYDCIVFGLLTARMGGFVVK